MPGTCQWAEPVQGAALLPLAPLAAWAGRMPQQWSLAVTVLLLVCASGGDITPHYTRSSISRASLPPSSSPHTTAYYFHMKNGGKKGNKNQFSTCVITATVERTFNFLSSNSQVSSL